MPIYEFVCMSCETHFEELVRGDMEIACPECGATKVAKQLSTFAMVGNAGQTGAFSSGGRLLRRKLWLRSLSFRAATS